MSLHCLSSPLCLLQRPLRQFLHRKKSLLPARLTFVQRASSHRPKNKHYEWRKGNGGRSRETHLIRESTNLLKWTESRALKSKRRQHWRVSWRMGKVWRLLERRARRRRVKRSRILQNNQHFIICAIVCIAVTVIEFVTVIIIIIFVWVWNLILRIQ